MQSKVSTNKLEYYNIMASNINMGGKDGLLCIESTIKLTMVSTGMVEPIYSIVGILILYSKNSLGLQ